MKISYVVHKSTLETDPYPYRAMVEHTGKATHEDVIRRALEGNPAVNDAALQAVLTEYIKAVINLLLQGYTVSTPIGNIRLSIKGGFNSKTDTFDTNRHTLEVNIYPNAGLREAVQSGAEMQKVESHTPEPNLDEFTNVNTNDIDSIVTPGGMGQVRGRRLKFDATDPNQGVFFINGTETRVTVVGKNTATELMFLIPTLDPGQYALEVRSTFGQEVRSGRLDTLLTV
ncbi:MAG: DUF4469 domain-containing protein [Anaerolineae bacterium]|nr:DUF4469 domain-containing protein [Anaerolineae bacterium]